MELLGIIIAATLVIISIVLLALIIILTRINERNQALYGEIFDRIDELEKDRQGFVTDPFDRPKEKFSSTTHIIQPKTPDQIRNENFKKIVEEGKTYGSVV